MECKINVLNVKIFIFLKIQFGVILLMNMKIVFYLMVLAMNVFNAKETELKMN